jgi:hypothetical protein
MNDADYVWNALAAQPLRRAILGRERCEAIVAVARDKMPTAEDLVAAGRGTTGERLVRLDLERRVREEYHERCGFAFTTMILWWAIAAIVEALVRKWWESNR